MNDLHGSFRRTRQTTSPCEQGILLAYIKKYFSFPERSRGRTDVVYEVLNLLVQKEDRWSARLVRLWFNNNRRNYCALINENKPPLKKSYHGNMPKQGGGVQQLSMQQSYNQIDFSNSKGEEIHHFLNSQNSMNSLNSLNNLNGTSGLIHSGGFSNHHSEPTLASLNYSIISNEAIDPSLQISSSHFNNNNNIIGLHHINHTNCINRNTSTINPLSGMLDSGKMSYSHGINNEVYSSPFSPQNYMNPPPLRERDSPKKIQPAANVLLKRKVIQVPQKI
ncbi:hypothetical protein TRFO_00975 [Tritrichomonas foetus]|uniref:Uncharacterized protein n=1 Tax=Tritrichomonas foetus TaxID=1144522 RepID=A0A1J4L2N6_9EUKA|nr:hypothetical protein TRFO_00975 [Tritrichomonas foetus]|eukprot:OHT17674.1 hypothetical protein TRFO_00975 [Tritrichomonas foetus]